MNKLEMCTEAELKASLILYFNNLSSKNMLPHRNAVQLKAYITRSLELVALGKLKRFALGQILAKV